RKGRRGSRTWRGLRKNNDYCLHGNPILPAGNVDRAGFPWAVCAQRGSGALMNDKLTYEWREEDGGKRPDRILAERLRCSRTQLQRWMKAGLVSAAGKPLEVTGRLHPGDLIEIRPPAPEPEQAVEAEEIPLRILHEDRD